MQATFSAALSILTAMAMTVLAAMVIMETAAELGLSREVIRTVALAAAVSVGALLAVGYFGKKF